MTHQQVHMGEEGVVCYRSNYAIPQPYIYQFFDIVFFAILVVWIFFKGEHAQRGPHKKNPPFFRKSL